MAVAEEMKLEGLKQVTALLGRVIQGTKAADGLLRMDESLKPAGVDDVVLESLEKMKGSLDVAAAQYAKMVRALRAAREQEKATLDMFGPATTE